MTDPNDIPSEEWITLLSPYLSAPPNTALIDSLKIYLQLLLRWNTRTNLTAIRDPRSIIQRHFGESLFLAEYVPRGTSTLLDHGSGAGLPGIPVAMVRPDIQVTLSESQLKKSAFLREAARVLELSNCKVHAGRTETLPSLAVFEAVVMRAVDDSGESHVKALSRVAPGGRLLTLEKAEREHEEFLFEAPVPYSIGVLRVYQP